MSNAKFPRGDRPWSAADTLKNVVFKVNLPDGSSYALAVGLPGDREVDLRRLEAAIAPGEAVPFEDADFAARPTLAKGYIGPGALGEDKPAGVKYLLDPRVVSGTRWITGSDISGKHVYDLVAGRDFTADGTIEAAEVREGDRCQCGGELEQARGIEIGHIFQLGRKYAKALDLTVLDENGKSVVVTMGSYGIGVSRLVAAIAEQHHDDKGLLWPREIAPADVHLVATGKDEAIWDKAESLASEFEAAGLRVLFDDRRSASPATSDARCSGRGPR